MKRTQRRILSGAVAMVVLSLLLLAPYQSALAAMEPRTSIRMIVFICPSEEDLSEGTDPESSAAESGAAPTPEPEAQDSQEPQAETVDPTPEPDATDAIDPAQETPQSEPTDDTESQSATDQPPEPAEVVSPTEDSGALDVTNEYIFYSTDASNALDICTLYGGSLLRWSDGVGVMYSASTPDGGDVVFYPQEIYIVESAPYYEQQGETYAQIGSAQTLASNAGAGVVVAVIDSGIDLDHPALIDSILQAVSVIPSSAYGSGGYFSAAYEGAQDYEGHGSHIAGIIAGQTDDLTIGIAPEAQIISIKALEKYGTSAAGTTEWLIHAIQYAISQNVDIINLSIGGSSSYVSAAQAVLQQAADAGILVVCATGNISGGAAADSIDYPAAYDSTLAVSCVTVGEDGVTLSEFSKYGEGTDLSAPGVAIYSCNAKGTYTVLSGTSMSCAVVSGVAALLLSQKTSLMPQGIITLLEKSAYDAGDQGYDTMFGWGVINAKSALLLLRYRPGQTEPVWPETNAEDDITQPAPAGQEADASNDWLTTQQGEQSDQSEQAPIGANSLDSGGKLRKMTALTWILLSFGGALCLLGAGLLLRVRLLRKPR